MSRHPKRESTAIYGIPTPEDSTMSTSTSPKRESVSVRWSDIPEDNAQGRDNSMSGNQNEPRKRPRQGEHSMGSTHSDDAGPRSGLEIVGHNVIALMDAIEELREIGLKQHATCLPELVLVGDQSSGKSSLMSAIAGINLPQGTGTCTRCPTNIRTSEASTWRCEVSLQITYKYDPKVRSQPFPHWVERQDGGEMKPFKVIDNKSELEETLKWAQIAILNPEKDSSYFLPGTATQAQEALLRNEEGHREPAVFSPNIIRISISGPRLPNLSFFDLPGNYSCRRDDYDKDGPKFCEQLSIEYIKHERALIICAMSMKNDPGVSSTSEIVNRCKANDRCVGVLTMPDRMEGTYHTDYNDMFHRRAYKLRNGYFVAKQPGANSVLSQNPLAPNYHTLALKEEKKYFDDSTLWRKGGKWSQFRDRCGTPVIQKFLATEFTRMILQSIPDIKKDIRLQDQELKKELAQLPEISTDQAQFTVLERLREFSTDAEHLLIGKRAPHGQETFHTQWKVVSKQFQDALNVMQPELICTHSADKSSDRMQFRSDQQINLVSDDEEMGEDNGFRKPATKRQAPNGQFPRTPSKGQPNSRAQTPVTPVKQETMASPGSSRKLTLPNQNIGQLGPFRQDYLHRGRSSMSIEEIQKEIDRCTIIGIPDAIPHEIKEEYALTAIHPWKEPLETYHDVTFDILKQEMNSVLSDVLRNYQDTELYRGSKEHVNDFINHHENIQRERLTSLYDIESASLFTMNIPGFRGHKQSVLEKLVATRREARVQAWLAANRVAKEKEQQLRKNFKEEDLAKYPLYSKEIDVAAYVIGYYNLARIRFVEAVCGNTKVSLFMEMKKGIKYLLEGKFELNSGDCEAKCQLLLAGNAQLVQRRQELLNTQNKLEAATKVLERISGLTNSGPNDAASDITMQHDNNGMDLDQDEDNNGSDAEMRTFRPARGDTPIDFSPKTSNGAFRSGGGRR